MLGGMLVVFGTGWIVRQAGVVDVSWPSILAAVLITLGAGMVITARSTRRSRGVVALGLLLTLIVASTSSLESKLNLSGGDVRYRPEAIADVAPAYKLGFGELVVDLTALRDLDEGRVIPVEAKVAFGELVVVVPREAAINVDGTVGAGELTVDGRQLGDGLGVSKGFTSRGYATTTGRRVDLNLSVFFGSIEVRRGR